MEEIDNLSREDELAFLMAIDVINSRNDLRAMRTNNLSNVKPEAADKIANDLNKRAYPENRDKVRSFDEIEKIFKGK